MQEAEGRTLALGQRAPVAAHRFKQAERADDVGLDEVLGPVDGAVYMRLGRKIHHRAGLVLGQQSSHQLRVTDVPLHKDMARIPLHTVQIVQIARISELVEVDHGLTGGSEPVKDKVGANETRAAGYQNHREAVCGARWAKPVIIPARLTSG